MEKIFYAADAYLPSYDQGADMIMVKSSAGALWGVSLEFDICTRDIALATVPRNATFDEHDPRFAQAHWVEYSDAIGLVPAGWEDLMHAGLSDHVCGYQLGSELGIRRFK
ncbi:hypothetical protein JFV28_13365 [Pseudomonas sp. TH05]|uniref:hypothetical protein n=1 Tax=unclassified Pseudomonas TaxID=196821 RepID=UPI0019117C5B|nr:MULTISPECIES: hypothetical protein [unclassified Pseudomonas]MBK5538170.1 hypothetical protein [Pseudomonas sp. TH07]MBK5556849.1 hypothetical protein [Pseudomonas sp. TH05]